MDDSSSSAKAPLSGVKRKHDALQASQPPTHAPLARPMQPCNEPLTPVLERDVESENLAWLDMLVALLERKYRRHAPPVAIDALEAAKPFVPRVAGHAPPISNSSVTESASALSRRVSSSSSRQARGVLGSSAIATKDSSSVSLSGADDVAERETEERRLRVLLRHAQQIQDSSVSSSACCGCKTGCLKMYVPLPQSCATHLLSPHCRTIRRDVL